MKTLPLKLTSDTLVLCVFLSLLWCATPIPNTNSTTTAQSPPNSEDKNAFAAVTKRDETTAMEMEIKLVSEFSTSPPITPTDTETTITTPAPTTRPPPPDVQAVSVIRISENSVTLQWEKVQSISTYRLQYVSNGNLMTENINQPDHDVIIHVLTGLSPGTKYDITIFTVLEASISTGLTFTAATAPINAVGFMSNGESETRITLKWDKVSGFLNYTLVFMATTINNIIAKEEDAVVTYNVLNLTSGILYNFTLFTVFENVRSSGVYHIAATAPLNTDNFEVVTQNETSVTLEWNKVADILDYTLVYDDITTNIAAEEGGETVTYSVINLASGILYNFTLFTVFEKVRSSGVNHIAPTAPLNTDDFKVVTQNETSVTLEWNKVADILDYTLMYDDITTNIAAEEGGETVTYSVINLASGILYNFTLFTVFEKVRSSGVYHIAPTAPLNTDNFKVVTQNETSVTLEWNKVADILYYTLMYDDITTNITAEEEDKTVTYNVLNLTSGVLHSFTLFTVFENVRSSGVNHVAPTAPRNTDNFKVVTQNETSVTLEWNKVADILDYTLIYDDITTNIAAEEGGETVTYTVSNLTSGILHNFTVFTVFENVQSSGKSLPAATVPRKAEGFKVHSQNETSITLQWQKVGDILNYELTFGERNISVDNVTEDNGILMYTIPDLSSGILYSFTLFTIFENLYSSGEKYEAATVPPMLASVNVRKRTVTSVVLEWESVREDWHYALTINGATVPITLEPSSKVVSHPVTSLEPGTEYQFNVTTIFMELNSTAYENFTVTPIHCANVDWHVTDSSIEGMVQGLVSNVKATNGTDTHTSPGANNVSFTSLYPGATYEMFFVYEKDFRTFLQCHHRLTIIPPSLSAGCKDWAAGYSIYIFWDRPYGMWNAVEVDVASHVRTVGTNGEQHAEIPGFQPAKSYKVSIVSVSGIERSEPFVFFCKTDARGVIAGSVMAVLLFGVLIAAIVIIMLKRPDIISKETFIRGSKQPFKNKKSQAIPVANFPSHFNQLDADDSRGFSQEYESLGIVGTEQTRKAAILPENKAKNRFTNILPYDWSRVKLTSSNADDYINANYMPGYNRNREYIATQGPLPSTVNDFWKMIWEQRVKGIVMVTNCTEGGRPKCEKYWPEDKRPIFHGQLMITLASEEQEPNWTLREFRLKHRQTPEERTVKHFHFTAWPDHGVPQGTEVLVQFRGLIRRHIQADAGGTPTVVHCSAGVGRTGTIIALDVLLQQLEKENAVDINGFVYKMRLSRSHMVQTESQYVFLHQCIMDRLQTTDISNENLYENMDMIYANATALRELP